MGGQTFTAPSGITSKMDEKNHHLHKSVFIGEVKADGQFNVVWKTKGPVVADPWSDYIAENKGKLNVADPVAKYLPEFANLRTPSGKPANLTISQILTHTSGLPEYAEDNEEIPDLAERAERENRRRDRDGGPGTYRERIYVQRERGNLLVSITLAPTAPPQVQFLEVKPAPASGTVSRPLLCSGS